MLMLQACTAMPKQKFEMTLTQSYLKHMPYCLPIVLKFRTLSLNVLQVSASLFRLVCEEKTAANFFPYLNRCFDKTSLCLETSAANWMHKCRFRQQDHISVADCPSTAKMRSRLVAHRMNAPRNSMPCELLSWEVGPFRSPFPHHLCYH